MYSSTTSVVQPDTKITKAFVRQSRRVVPNPPGLLNRNHNQPNGVKSAIVHSNVAQGDGDLLEALMNSKVFADYQRAFTVATGLPVALCSVQSWQLPHHGRCNEGLFCALLADKNRSCGACLTMLDKVSKAATHHLHTSVCHVGLSESAVPVRLGDRLIGFLKTGQVFCKPPSERQFQRTCASAKLPTKQGSSRSLISTACLRTSSARRLPAIGRGRWE